MDDNHRETRWHEAGHAVFSRVLCKQGGEAALLDPDCAVAFDTARGRIVVEDADGYAVTAPRSKRNDRYFRSVLVTLGGAAAVEELLHETASGCEVDYAQADAILRELNFDPPEPMRRHLLLEARALARKHRRKIRKVALALKRHRKLTGAQIDQLIED
jgi:hypothetical protein